MNTPRFFIKPEFIDENKNVIYLTDANLLKQVRKVLRLENGDKLIILDGNGNYYECVLEFQAQSKPVQQAQARILTKTHNNDRPGTKITVALPLIKPNRFEVALEKLTELGADTIIPVAVHRSVIKINSAEAKDHQIKFSRWQKITEEACEQCERTMPPRLMPVTTLSQWLSALKDVPNELRIICTERKKVLPLETLLYNLKDPPAACAIALGAEGGLTEEEINLALSKNFHSVSLGSLIMRSETAAIYTLAVVNTILRLIKNIHNDS